MLKGSLFRTPRSVTCMKDRWKRASVSTHHVCVLGEDWSKCMVPNLVTRRSKPRPLHEDDQNLHALQNPRTKRLKGTKSESGKILTINSLLCRVCTAGGQEDGKRSDEPDQDKEKRA